MAAVRKPKIAVWKFASCDGCQLSLLDCEDELLSVVGAVEIANFPEATRAVVKGPYDISLVEGSITTPHDEERIHTIRRSSKLLITIGACATSGGIQALRNFKNVADFIPMVYAKPEYIKTLSKSTPINDHVFVDFQLRGCPINKLQLVEVLNAFLNRRKPVTPAHGVCMECKRRGTVCVMVANGTPCLGPVTLAGCGALCPATIAAATGALDKGNTQYHFDERGWTALGVTEPELMRAFRSFNAYAEAFRKESEAHETLRPSRSMSLHASRVRAACSSGCAISASRK